MEWRYILLAFVSYLGLVRVLRYRRRDAARKRFPTRETFGSMTLDEAFHINSRLGMLEFPTVFPVSVFFALFKTYGIPSISKLLLQTGQLADKTTASKRTADTAVLLTEVTTHRPSSRRAIEGIARMNYLHSIYRKAGKISDADMLYTLSLFALEPIRWARKFEWREVSDVERCAIGTYYRFLGDAMEIPYTPLESHEDWTDGLHFIDDLAAWSERYEAENMIPSKTNLAVVQGTIDVGLYNVPSALRPLCMPVVSALIEPHVRKAMMLEDPHPYVPIALGFVVGLRKLMLRYLALPRPYFLRDKWCSEGLNSFGKFYAQQSISLPWYIEPTFLARWGPKAWVLRLVGAKVPGDHGDAYMPEGYVVSEIGPEKMKSRGKEHMEETCRRLESYQSFGCPFAR